MLSTDLPTLRTVTSSLLPGVTGTGNAVILQGCLPMVASSLLPGEGGGVTGTGNALGWVPSGPQVFRLKLKPPCPLPAPPRDCARRAACATVPTSLPSVSYRKLKSCVHLPSALRVPARRSSSGHTRVRPAGHAGHPGPPQTHCLHTAASVLSRRCQS